MWKLTSTISQARTILMQMPLVDGTTQVTHRTIFFSKTASNFNFRLCGNLTGCRNLFLHPHGFLGNFQGRSCESLPNFPFCELLDNPTCYEGFVLAVLSIVVNSCLWGSEIHWQHVLDRRIRSLRDKLSSNAKREYWISASDFVGNSRCLLLKGFENLFECFCKYTYIYMYLCVCGFCLGYISCMWYN